MNFLRRLLIRFLTPAVWSASPDRKSRALQEFSLIEKDSGCQLFSAIRLVEDPLVRAQLFQHVLEEFHHADLFGRASASCARAPLEVPVVTRDELVEADAGPGALLDFVAYVHAGESAVNADFEAYADSVADPRLRGVFRAVNADEAGHEESSRALLLAVAGGDAGRARRALWKAGAKRLWRSYVRAMRGIGEIPLALLLSVLYFASGPFVVRSLRRRLALSPGEELALLLEQAGPPAR